MKIQIKSDLHLDESVAPFRNRASMLDKNLDLVVNPQAEVLILAGDIVENKPDIYDNAFGYLTIPVIYVPGNHEYRFGDVDKTPANLKHMFRDTNVHLLDRDYVLIHDTMFIGATLWTPLSYPRIPIDNNSIVPWHTCAGMDDEWWGKSFHKDLTFIKSCLEDPLFKDYKKVVVTHFLPSEQSVGKRFIGHPLNRYFVSTEPVALMHSENAPLIWAHGHTHNSFDYIEGNTRVICNPHGAYGRDVNPEFKPQLVVEI